MNLLGFAHDPKESIDILFVADGSLRRLDYTHLTASGNPIYSASLVTLPGAPSIYYGDELAMSGRADPDCRRAFPPSLDTVDEPAREHRRFVRAAIHARREHAALRRGTVRPTWTAGRAIALERTGDGRRAIVAVNAADDPIELAVGIEALGGLRRLDDLNLGFAEVRPGGNALALGPRSAMVLVEG